MKRLILIALFSLSAHGQVDLGLEAKHPTAGLYVRTSKHSIITDLKLTPWAGKVVAKGKYIYTVKTSGKHYWTPFETVLRPLGSNSFIGSFKFRMAYPSGHSCIVPASLRIEAFEKGAYVLVYHYAQLHRF